MRGLAALSVVLFHVINAPLGFETNGFVRGLAVNGAHGVQVFFVISGVVIPLSLMRKRYTWRDFSRFMWKRSVRLEPTYLAVIVLSLLWIPARAFITGEAMIEPPSVQVLLLNVFYLVPFFGENWMNSVFWTLGIELQFYLLCAVIFGFKRSKFTDGLLWFLPIVCLFVTKFSSPHFVTQWLSFFLAGGLMAMYLDGRISKEKLGALILLCHISVSQSHGHYFASIQTLSVLVILFFPKRTGGFWLQFLGRQSYSLYLIHTLVGITLVNASMRYLEFQDSVLHWVIIIVATLASICAAQVLYVCVERPSMNWSKRVQVNKDS